jgi:uncharacterized protein (DUF433 family)
MGQGVSMIDWTECAEVEMVPGKVGGRPVIRGTRIEPELVLVEAEFGRTPEETHADFPTLSLQTICALREFAEKQKQVA